MTTIDKTELLAVRELYAATPDFNIAGLETFIMFSRVLGMTDIVEKATDMLDIELLANQSKVVAIQTIDKYLENPTDKQNIIDMAYLKASEELMLILLDRHDAIEKEIDGVLLNGNLGEGYPYV